MWLPALDYNCVAVLQAWRLDIERQAQIIDIRRVRDLRDHSEGQFLTNVFLENCLGETERKFRKIVGNGR